MNAYEVLVCLKDVREDTFSVNSPISVGGEGD